MDQQLSEQAHKELLAVFEDRVANIRDLKRYEWQAAYYALALIGALVVIAHWSPLNWVTRLLLAIGCGIVAWTWFSVETSLKQGLERQRKGEEAIYGLFSEEVRATKPERLDDGMARALWFLVFATAGLAAFAIAFLLVPCCCVSWRNGRGADTLNTTTRRSVSVAK